MIPRDPQPQPVACTWCGCEYLAYTSRAKSSTLFCTRKCETEARAWLYVELVGTQS